MKKLLAIIAVALAAVFTLSSTSVYAVEGLSVGIKAGLNLADLYGDDVDAFSVHRVLPSVNDMKKETKTGASFGAFVTYDINDFFAVQPELLYSMKGARWKGVWVESMSGNVTYEQTMSLNYLEIPLLAKVSIPIGENFKYNILIGPALGIITSAKLKHEITGVSEYFKQMLEDIGVSTSGEEDIDHAKSIEFGLVFGGGVDFKLGPGKVIIDARYTLGLTNIFSDISLDYIALFGLEPIYIEDPDIKNSVISIMAGYSFSLGK
ncbi:MAG: PorT family protein [Deltaproteobacteria bacterium]|nr:MAG: PorT family protein [Deltaproteobacteria bacterium]